MIILPERGAPRGKLLMPQRPREWRAPSQRTVTFGIENQTRFRLTGRLHDGAIRWRAFFDDRDDADAFLFGLITGSLRYERALWSLPVETWTPDCGYRLSNSVIGWHPDFGEHLTYDFATVTFLTASPGGNLTYNVPSDWNNSNNGVELIGGASAGANANASSNPGGGGGAYSAITNITLTPGGTTTYQIGAGGATVNAAGGDSWFGAATFGASLVGAKAGAASSVYTGGVGGAAASGVGTTTHSGGNGGTGANTSNGGGGGGGAGGPRGDGGNGGSVSVNDGATGSGGNGGGGSGGGGAGTNGSNGSTNNVRDGGNGGNNAASAGAGTGGTAAGTLNGTNGSNGGGGGAGAELAGGTNAGTGGNGGAGTDWDASHGAGGGAASAGWGTGATGKANGAAGLYGAGGAGAGGGVAGANSNWTAGAQGIEVVTYVPLGLPFCGIDMMFYLP